MRNVMRWNFGAATFARETLPQNQLLPGTAPRSTEADLDAPHINLWAIQILATRRYFTKSLNFDEDRASNLYVRIQWGKKNDPVLLSFFSPFDGIGPWIRKNFPCHDGRGSLPRDTYCVLTDTVRRHHDNSSKKDSLSLKRIVARKKGQRRKVPFP